MEKFLKTLKFIFITFVWSFLYFGFVRSSFMGIREFNGFDILRPSHWEAIYAKWNSGWVLIHSYENVFFFSLLFFIPVWFLVLWFLLKFEYLKFFKKVASVRKNKIAKKKAEEALLNPPKIPVFKRSGEVLKRPIPLRVLSSSEFKKKDKKPSKSKPPKAISALVERPNYKAEEPEIEENDGIMSEEEILSNNTFVDDGLPDFETESPKDKGEPLVSGETVDEILENAKYKVLKDVSLDEEKIDYLAFSKDTVLFVKYFNDEGQWLADEIPFRDEEPQWFSEVNQKTSPVKIIADMAEEFRLKIENRLNVVPVLIITNANIMNAEEILKTWEDLHILVAVHENGGPTEVLLSVNRIIPPLSDIADDEVINEIKSLL